MMIPILNHDLFSNTLSPKSSSSSQTTKSNNVILFSGNHERNQSDQPYGSIFSKESLPKTINLNLEAGGNAETQQENQTDADTFKVYVRWRPLDQKEKSINNPKKRLNILQKQDNMIVVYDPDYHQEYSIKKEKSYIFDDIFDDEQKTESIYKQVVEPGLDNVLNGYNSTIFAYGMTGAGKTYTMFGDINNINGGTDCEPGLITLTIKDMLKSFALETNEEYEFVAKLSYLEIYNEHARDLFTNGSENLMILEDPQKGVLVPNLTEFIITTLEEVIGLIQLGNSRRVMATTQANQFSSRSHAIIQLVIEKRPRDEEMIETYMQSKLCLVDLAGSERAATSENKGLRQQEGANINRSLLALGNCINILGDTNKKGAFVPYRDSKLTRLLKDSLGGNTKTIMIACVSPSFMAYEETINTLKYANRARNIKKLTTQNFKEAELHVSQYKGIIEALKKEINFLRAQLEEKNQGINTHPSINNSGNSDGQANNVHANKVGMNSNAQHIDLDNNTKKVLNNLFESSSLQSTSQEIQNSIDNLIAKFFANLEENWEITQTLNELQELKAQNEALFVKKDRMIKETRDHAEKSKLNEQIKQLKEVMSNNQKIEQEAQLNLQKNQEERKKIQDNIRRVSTSVYGVHHLHEACKNLNIEKYEFCTQNQEIIQAAKSLFQEREQKDSRILQLEKEMQLMKEQLAEKDRVIAKNQELINHLANTNNNTNSNANSNANNNTKAGAKRPLSKKEPKQNFSSPREKFVETGDNAKPSGGPSVGSTLTQNLSPTQKRAKSPTIGVPHYAQQQNHQPYPDLNNFRTVQDQKTLVTSKLSQYIPNAQQLNMDINSAKQDTAKIKNKTSISDNTISQQMGRNSQKSTKDQLSIQDVRAYGENSKEMNIDDKAKTIKAKDPIKNNIPKAIENYQNPITKITESSNNPSQDKRTHLSPSSRLKNPNILKQVQINPNKISASTKNSKDSSPQKGFNANKKNLVSFDPNMDCNQNFCELSSIMKGGTNLDTSCDTSIKDILVENLPPKLDSLFTLKNNGLTYTQENNSKPNQGLTNRNQEEVKQLPNDKNVFHLNLKNLKVAKSPGPALKNTNNNNTNNSNNNTYNAESKSKKYPASPRLHDVKTEKNRPSTLLIKQSCDFSNKNTQNVDGYLDEKGKSPYDKFGFIPGVSKTVNIQLDAYGPKPFETNKTSNQNINTPIDANNIRKTKDDSTTTTTTTAITTISTANIKNPRCKTATELPISILNNQSNQTGSFHRVNNKSAQLETERENEQISSSSAKYDEKDVIVTLNNNIQDESKKKAEVNNVQNSEENENKRSRNSSSIKNEFKTSKTTSNININISCEKPDLNNQFLSPKSSKNIPKKVTEEPKISKVNINKGTGQIGLNSTKSSNKTTNTNVSSKDKAASLPKGSIQLNNIKYQYPDNVSSVEVDKISSQMSESLNN